MRLINNLAVLEAEKRIETIEQERGVFYQMKEKCEK